MVLADTLYDHPTVDGFQNDGVVLFSARAQRVHNGTGPFALPSSRTPTAFNLMD